MQLKFYFPPADCPAHRLPIHRGDLFDGRSGYQILISAIFYLSWCSGREWRPASHRYHPTVEYFVDGIRLLKPIAAQFAQCRPFTSEQNKKPVAAAKAAAASRRSA